MIVIRDINVLKNTELVATVGFFDGVHLGHRFLIREMQESAASRGLPSAVITFPQHPRKVLHADYQPQLLNSFEEKLQHLEETGVDYCIILDFTPVLSQLSAKDFLCNILSKGMHVKELWVGYDHRFGHDRAEGFPQYQLYGAECGIDVIQGPPYKEEKNSISSSIIRKLLENGEVEKSAHLLTYHYQLKGAIVGGHKIGRTLGFPTANIRVDEPFKVIPAIGVYAVKVTLYGNTYRGMLYIGNRPTLNNGNDITMEVNILDFSGDIYNNEITVTFIRYIRGDIRFHSLDELKIQLMHDRETVEKLLPANC